MAFIALISQLNFLCPFSVTPVLNEVNGEKLPALTIIKDYTYDDRDNRLSLTITRNGETALSLTYEYDSMNRLEKVYDNGILQVTYAYDANGNRSSMTYNSNGVVTTYWYNAANLVTDVINKKESTNLSVYSYSYRLDGNQTCKRDHENIITDYQYDALGRLTNENERIPVGVRGALAETIVSKSYTYDKANNRKSMIVSTNVGGVETSGYSTLYTCNQNNQLQTEKQKLRDGVEITSIYEYYANGNCTKKQVQVPVINYSAYNSYSYNLKRQKVYRIDKSDTNYFYDVFNRLIEVAQAANAIKYRYKTDGLQLAITANQSGQTQTNLHIWDASSLIAVLDGNGGLTNKYIRGINLIKTIPASGSDNESYFLFNAHGDVVQLMDTFGSVKKNYYYDSFGVEINPDSDDANPWRYCGEFGILGQRPIIYGHDIMTLLILGCFRRILCLAIR